MYAFCVNFAIKTHTRMIRWTYIGGFLSHYKYLITIVVGIAIVGFIDENSFMQRAKYEWQIKEMKEEIHRYNTLYEKDSKQLHMLESDPRNIEKIARERYFMKADDEDIFVLSTDEDNTTKENETAQ